MEHIYRSLTFTPSDVKYSGFTQVGATERALRAARPIAQGPRSVLDFPAKPGRAWPRKRGRLPLLTLSTPSNSASNARRSAPPRSLTEIWPAEILKEILIFTISRRARASSA